MADNLFVVALWAAIIAGIFALPLPLRCERPWCFREQVGVSVYCRKHTDEIMEDTTNG